MPFFTRRFRFSFFSLILCLLALGLFLSRFHPRLSSEEDKFLHRVTSPVFSILQHFRQTAQGFLERYGFHPQIFDENQILKKALLESTQKLRALEEEMANYKRLSTLLSFSKTLNRPSVSGRIIAYHPLPQMGSLLLDIGSEKGIETGQAVIAPEGVVGRIIKTSPKDSMVLLITDSSFYLTGEIRPSGARGVLHGEQKLLGLNRDHWITRMEYLNLGQEIHEQDEVVSSGLDGIFPPGILIGKVQNVFLDPKGFFLSAEVIPAVEISKLKEVLVLTNIRQP